MNAAHVDECHSEHQPHPHTGERHGCIINSYGGREWVPCPEDEATLCGKRDEAGDFYCLGCAEDARMGDLLEAVTLAIGNADGQAWETLDDAPSRAAYMGYPAMAHAAIAAIIRAGALK